MVQKGKDYIKEGDIFQVVLSNRMEADMEGSILDTYRVLRTSNPSPYMFYFSSEDVEIAGASPETLVKLEMISCTLSRWQAQEKEARQKLKTRDWSRNC